MAREIRMSGQPGAEDIEAGDDSDSPGLDRPYSADDIDAIVNSPGASVAERRAALSSLLADAEARLGMDETGDQADIADEIRRALSALQQTADGIGGPGAYGLDPDDQVIEPDEILERDQHEQ